MSFIENQSNPEEGLCICGDEFDFESEEFDDTVVIYYWHCHSCGRRYKEVFTHYSIEEIK